MISHDYELHSHLSTWCSFGNWNGKVLLLEKSGSTLALSNTWLRKIFQDLRHRGGRVINQHRIGAVLAHWTSSSRKWQEGGLLNFLVKWTMRTTHRCSVCKIGGHHRPRYMWRGSTNPNGAGDGRQRILRQPNGISKELNIASNLALGTVQQIAITDEFSHNMWNGF